MVKPTIWWISPIVTSHRYRIREKQSGLCLHYQTNTNEGHFCLGRFDENDNTYVFTFTQAPGFTAFYRVRSGTHYMSYDSSASWRIISATTAPTDKNGYIQVERLPDGNAHLRCGWQNSLHVGFDSRSVGSYIYANKTSAGEFILEDIDEEAVGISLAPASSQGEEEWYDLSGRRIENGATSNHELPRGIFIQRQSDGKTRKILR
jgi:hypothetical protein